MWQGQGSRVKVSLSNPHNHKRCDFFCTNCARSFPSTFLHLHATYLPHIILPSMRSCGAGHSFGSRNKVRCNPMKERWQRQHKEHPTKTTKTGLQELWGHFRK